jgi:hypothetical protein
MSHHKVSCLCGFISIFLFSQPLFSQCYPDRHNSNIENMWLSCSAKSNPNPTRNNGHWILYEFDEEKRIVELQFWNINHPDHLESGSRIISVDYRNQIGEWEHHETYTLSKGTGSGFYEGEVFTLLEHFTTGQVLLSIAENYGGQCAGLAEVKFNVLSSTTSTEDIDEDHFEVTISPNPFDQLTTITIRGLNEKEITYEVINALGQSTKRNVIQTSNGTAQFDIIAQSLPPGNYFLKITDGFRVSSRKLSVQNQ